MTSTHRALDWVEQGLVPDPLIRAGIRRLLRQRLVEIRAAIATPPRQLCAAFVAEMRTAPIALVPDKANEQHYEVPAAFFAEVLGRHRKYSCLLVARRRRPRSMRRRGRACRDLRARRAGRRPAAFSNSAAAGAR